MSSFSSKIAWLLATLKSLTKKLAVFPTAVIIMLLRIVENLFFDILMTTDSSFLFFQQTKIQLLFADTHIEPQARCYACSYIEADNGEQNGNLYCGQMEDADPEANINSLVQNCPLHASLGCYTGTSIHNFLSSVL